jgi:hypothetical protein
MSHEMARGGACGLRDGHKGHHRSQRWMEKYRAMDRKRSHERWHGDAAYRAANLARARERYQNDPVYREACRARSSKARGTAAGMLTEARRGSRRRGNG